MAIGAAWVAAKTPAAASAQAQSAKPARARARPSGKESIPSSFTVAAPLHEASAAPLPRQPVRIVACSPGEPLYSKGPFGAHRKGDTRRGRAPGDRVRRATEALARHFRLGFLRIQK